MYNNRQQMKKGIPKTRQRRYSFIAFRPAEHMELRLRRLAAKRGEPISRVLHLCLTEGLPKFEAL
jgi:hypothetical protein